MAKVITRYHKTDGVSLQEVGDFLCKLISRGSKISSATDMHIERQHILLL
jgi:hypothetical protein